MQRPGQRFDMEPFRSVDGVEEGARHHRFRTAERPYEPLEGRDQQLAGLEGENWLEGAAQRMDAPRARHRSVVVPDDMGEPDALRHGPSYSGMLARLLRQIPT